MDEYLGDEWPQMPDGSDFDGTQLLLLVRSGKSPFDRDWDVNLLINEIETEISTRGFHITLSNRPDIIARLARSDVNVPNYGSFPIKVLAAEAKFEAAVYELLRSEPNILASHLLYHRIPIQHDPPRVEHPKDITGRRLFLFAKTAGENNIWNLSEDNRVGLLTHLAYVRALLFNFQLPLDFAATWLQDRLFEPKPERLALPVAPTREFCIALLTAKVEATIRNLGDMIGWEDDKNTVGPLAVAAKQSILRLIPNIIPADDNNSDQGSSLYRLVLEHGDYGIHNVSIATQEGSGRPLVTSLYDWETACIVPAILSDPLVAVTVDLIVDGDGNPSITRVPEHEGPEMRHEYMKWSQEYTRVLFDRAPNYRDSIRAGEDARYLWFALRDWRGDDPEDYFGALGALAEKKLKAFKLQSEVDNVIEIVRRLDISGMSKEEMRERTIMELEVYRARRELFKCRCIESEDVLLGL